MTEGSLEVGKRSVAGAGGGDPVDCCGSVSWSFCQRFCNARNPLLLGIDNSKRSPMPGA